MELVKYKSADFGIIRDEISLVCTTEERDILRELLAHYGVNWGTCVSSHALCVCYVENAYREAVQAWGDDRCRQYAEEHFDRYKNH